MKILRQIFENEYSNPKELLKRNKLSRRETLLLSGSSMSSKRQCALLAHQESSGMSGKESALLRHALMVHIG